MRHRRWKAALSAAILLAALADLAVVSACRGIQLETLALASPPPLPRQKAPGPAKSLLLALTTLPIGPDRAPAPEETAASARDLAAEMREDYLLVAAPWSYGDAPDSRLAMVLHLPTGQQSILRPASATGEHNRHEGVLLTREGEELEVLEVTADGIHFAVPDAGAPGLLSYDPELLAEVERGRAALASPVVRSTPARRLR